MIVVVRLKPRWAVHCLNGFLRSHWKLTTAAAALAAGVALSAATVGDVPRGFILPIVIVKSDPDPRIARLERFFRNYHCQAPYHAVDYLRAADGYGLDYRLLPAVSIRETTCGLAEHQLQNNLWGYHPNDQSFPSIAAGIDFLARRLAEHPFYKGKSLKGKLFTYNPLPAYPDEVLRIMSQIE
jgi:hypothetical protein